ncbi:DinB family protein [Streptomyces sp. NBC_01218]|uniref:DinB family protein n=1 Tax=unclassified Streptomyces TaxID=2593676 RepID=UPI0023B8992A|nr:MULTISPECIES: DinB family protein [unclassified Streptomyces]WEH41229.1 DinB family protein [Streptomyces sp. AM 2-1-1]WSQ52857.1 DinB family protein [Streptomyces sp. NBC_01218]
MDEAGSTDDVARGGPSPALAPQPAERPRSSPDPEITALLACLRGQRQHVIGILDGLDAEALRRPVLPSGWSSLGLVRHLALDVERFWFRAVFLGDEEVLRALSEGGDAWRVPTDASPSDILGTYLTEAEHSDAVVAAALSADAPLARWPHHLFGEPHLHTLRDLLLHVVTETACHAGHLDAARELIDGRRWLVLT